MNKTNKTQKVLQHLQNKGSITSLEAYDLYGATRLSAIIFTLRKNYKINSEELKITDRYGNCCRYAKYVLVNNEIN